MNKSKISIIIPFHKKTIINTLNSLKKCNKINFCEIVLIGDGISTKFLDSYLKKSSLNIKIFKLKKLGKIGKLRNFGIKKANSEYCCFIDSDCKIDKHFIEKIISNLNKSDIIKGKNVFIGNNRISYYDAMLRRERYNSNPKFAYCPNLIVKKKVFENIGYFNENYYYGSDGEFAKRVEENNVGVIYDDSIVAYHDCTDSFLGVYKKWIKYGRGRYFRYENDNFKKRFSSLYKPVLFKLKNGINYNLVVFLCLTGRWIGMSQSFLKSKSNRK